MSDNKHVIKLLEFLNKHAVKGDVECTHTAFGPPWESFLLEMTQSKILQICIKKH